MDIHLVYLSSAIRQAELEWAVANNQPTYRLMENAVKALHSRINLTWPTAKSVSICCGKGNNGGDGYLLAATLADLGWSVRVIAIASPNVDSDAAKARQYCINHGVIPLSYDESVQIDFQHDLIVDALLGSGSRGRPYDEYLSLISQINACSNPVLSVDVPSGIDTDTAFVGENSEVVHATETLTFGALKPGLLTGRCSNFVGTRHVAKIGLQPFLANQQACSTFIEFPDFDLAVRTNAAHKGEMGSVALIGGNEFMGGAIILAAEACSRTGVGYVHCYTHGLNRSALLTRNPGLLVTDWYAGSKDSSPISSDIQASSFVIGPGLGLSEESRDIFDTVVQQCRRSKIPVVVDADGLTLLSESTDYYDHWVLTPHPKEAARLLGVASVKEIENNRLQSAKDIQAKYGGICLLKGAGTVVCSNEKLSINGSGNNGMARAGMGDILAGIIAGLIARFPQMDLFSITCLGVWMHGRAGDLAKKTGHVESMQAIDLISQLENVWSELRLG